MEEEGLIYNIKVSSVGPGKVTGPEGSMVEPGNMDLAMKLHYLRGVYYFGKQAFEGVSTLEVKEHMFMWLNQHPITCGRFSRNESARPFIKCNDCGVRFIEADCVTTLHHWLLHLHHNNENLLSSHQSIGPHLSFSPLIYIQLTKFKCGGAAVGLSWAHVLGDAFCAAEYMNSLGHVVAGFGPERPINLGHTPTKHPDTNGLLPKNVEEEPLSIKRVDPVGDNWLHVTKSKMEAFCFIVSPTQLSHLQAKSNDSPPFEAIAALIWRCIAKTRVQELEPRVVTVCKRSEPNYYYGNKNLRSYNSQVVSVVKADFPIVEASPSELAASLKNEALDERRMIEDAMERDHGLADFIVYGANLTFVNLEEAKFYDFDYRGEKPIKISYQIDGVGERGAVLVLPTMEKGGGRPVTAILPVNEMIGFESELKREGLVLWHE